MKQEQDYYQHPSISNSDIGLFLKSPSYFHHLKYGEGSKADSEDMSFGRLMHTAVLEPDKYRDAYAREGPDAPGGMMPALCEQYLCWLEDHPGSTMPDELDWEALYTRSGYKKNPLAQFITDQVQSYVQYRQENRFRQLIPHKDYQLIADMREALMSDDRNLIWLDQRHWELFNPRTEHEIYWHQQDQDLKSKLDRVYYRKKEAWIVDYKTTRHVNRREFLLDAIQVYDYPRQMAFYSDAVRQGLDISRVHHILVVQSKCRPYHSWRIRFDNRLLEDGRKRYIQALMDIARCQYTSNWHETEDEEGIYTATDQDYGI